MLTVKSVTHSPVFVTGVAATGVFLLDLELPNGVVDGILYVLVILLSARIPKPHATLATAAVLLPLMVLGFILSPMAAPFWVAVTNRVVSVLVVWTTAWLIWRHTRAIEADRTPDPQIDLLLQAAAREDLAFRLGVIEWRLQRLPYFAGSASALKKETLILSSALKNARHSVRTAGHSSTASWFAGNSN